MDVSSAVQSQQQQQQQQQLASAKKPGVLRSIMSKDYRRSELQRTATKERDAYAQHRDTQSIPLLPPDHPHAAIAAVDPNARSGRQPKQENTTSHKRSKSSVSLRSLGRSKDKDGEKDMEKERRRREKQAKAEGDEGRKNLKKTKSSTSLRNLLSKNRSSKDLSKDTTKDTIRFNQHAQHDKENLTPSQQHQSKPVDTPIWSQFAMTSNQEDSQFRPQQQDVDAEIARYTPQDYSPSKQRDFAAYGPPVLQRPTSSGRPTSSKRPSSSGRPPSSGRPSSSSRPTSSSRPKSALLSGSTSFMDIVTRKISNDKSQPRTSGDGTRPPSSSHQPAMDQSNSYFYPQSDRKTSAGSDGQPPARPTLSIAKRGSRVMAAVAALNGKTQEAAVVREDPKLDPKAVDAAFEAVLDSRNIPENMRQKMRTLTLRVKADFVKQDRGAPTPTSPTKPISKYSMWTGEDSQQTVTQETIKPADDAQFETKKSRSRSKTFTFTKTDASPAKKQKSEARPNSIHIPKSSGVTSALPSPLLTPGSGQARGHQPAVPEEFVKYLRMVRDPTQVEVGRLHKLRLLLRNETVAWVDLFISLGGMTEVVDLLHRIMTIEWREEHEDQLLHETLLCLKGLCTTAVALAKLEEMADTLFPGLFGLLFDEEKKGPSEFNTRAIIVNLLFAHLSAACHSSPETMAKRARSVLGYLTDPRKPEEAQPIGFVLEMRQPRPYRVWCNEVNSVSREVFWIFLHHLNVIPLPKRGSGSQKTSTAFPEEPRPLSRPGSRDPKDTSSLAQSYTKRHFPGDRPPVPAAPYIGGVEWDATTYMTAHLDLLNGLIASLPTKEERNKLRAEFKASGWEKVMGSTLRTCKEKFYCGVHSGLQSWVAAALEDGWDFDYVRYGPTQEKLAALSPKKSPKKSEPPPKIEAPLLDLPKLDLGLVAGGGGMDQDGNQESDGWLM